MKKMGGVQAVVVNAGPDSPIVIGGPQFYVLPAPNAKPPRNIEEFSKETYALVWWLNAVQPDEFNKYVGHYQFIAAVLFLAPRLRQVQEQFIDDLRRIHSSLPTLNGKPIKSFHEATISIADGWFRWLYTFLTPRDCQKSSQHVGHKKFDYLGKVACDRIRKKKAIAPFDRIDAETLLNGIEWESDRMPACDDAQALDKNQKAYLGIELDGENRALRRFGYKTIPFATKREQWPVVVKLVRNGAAGLSAEERRDIASDRDRPAWRTLKDRLITSLAPAGLTITGGEHWRLIALD